MPQLSYNAGLALISCSGLIAIAWVWYKSRNPLNTGITAIAAIIFIAMTAMNPREHLQSDSIMYHDKGENSSVVGRTRGGSESEMGENGAKILAS